MQFILVHRKKGQVVEEFLVEYDIDNSLNGILCLGSGQLVINEISFMSGRSNRHAASSTC